MLVIIFTIITTAVMIPAMTWALCNASKEADNALEHPDRINLKGE